METTTVQSYQNRIVAVTGALGNQGHSVANALLEKGWKVRALIRKLGENESPRSDDKQRRLSELQQRGCEIVDCLFDDRACMQEAFAGCWGAFCVTDFWAPEIHCTGNFKLEQQHGINQIEAAAAAGVSMLIFSSLPDLSSLCENRIDVPHFTNKAVIEKHARNHPTLKAAAFVWLGSFMSNFTNPRFGATPRLVEPMAGKSSVPSSTATTEAKNIPTGTGTIPSGLGALGVASGGGGIGYGAGPKEQEQASMSSSSSPLVVELPMRADVQIPLLDVDDCGAIVARMFEQGPERWAGKTVLIASEYLSLPEQCKIWREVTKRPVQYKRVSWDEYAQSHKEHSNKEVDAMFMAWDRVGCFAGADLEHTKRDFPDVKLTTFAEYLRSHPDDVQKTLQFCARKEQIEPGTHGVSQERSRHALFAPRTYTSPSAASRGISSSAIGGGGLGVGTFGATTASPSMSARFAEPGTGTAAQPSGLGERRVGREQPQLKKEMEKGQQQTFAAPVSAEMPGAGKKIGTGPGSASAGAETAASAASKTTATAPEIESAEAASPDQSQESMRWMSERTSALEQFQEVAREAAQAAASGHQGLHHVPPPKESHAPVLDTATISSRHAHEEMPPSWASAVAAGPMQQQQQLPRQQQRPYISELMERQQKQQQPSPPTQGRQFPSRTIEQQQQFPVQQQQQPVSSSLASPMMASKKVEQAPPGGAAVPTPPATPSRSGLKTIRFDQTTGVGRYGEAGLQLPPELEAEHQRATHHPLQTPQEKMFKPELEQPSPFFTQQEQQQQHPITTPEQAELQKEMRDQGFAMRPGYTQQQMGREERIAREQESARQQQRLEQDMGRQQQPSGGRVGRDWSWL